MHATISITVETSALAGNAAEQWTELKANYATAWKALVAHYAEVQTEYATECGQKLDYITMGDIALGDSCCVRVGGTAIFGIPNPKHHWSSPMAVYKEAMAKMNAALPLVRVAYANALLK